LTLFIFIITMRKVFVLCF